MTAFGDKMWWKRGVQNRNYAISETPSYQAFQYLIFYNPPCFYGLLDFLVSK
jgi:hypothetical protein